MRPEMDEHEQDVQFSDFEMQLVLGRGTFGKVYLTKNKKNGKLYAVKTLRKDQLIETNSIKNTLNEKDILFQCDH